MTHEGHDGPEGADRRIIVQLGDPDFRCSRNYRDRKLLHEHLRRDRRYGCHGQCCLLTLIGRHFLDAVERADGPVILYHLAGYLDRGSFFETVDRDHETDRVILVKFDSGNRAERHLSVLSRVCAYWGEVSERRPDPRKIALALIQLKGLAGRGAPFVGAA